MSSLVGQLDQNRFNTIPYIYIRLKLKNYISRYCINLRPDLIHQLNGSNRSQPIDMSLDVYGRTGIFGQFCCLVRANRILWTRADSKEYFILWLTADEQKEASEVAGNLD